MTTRYRLLKGSACDFVGAPANVRLAIRHRMDNRLAWCEKLETYATMWEPGKKNAYFIGNKENWFLVGIREPVAGDEQDLNECIGAPEADEKRGGFIPNTAFVGDLNNEPSIMGVPLRKIDGAEIVNYPGIDAITTERGSRYGKFKDGAEIMQELKDVMREVDGWRNLTPSQREALDMIQHKIGRILNGDPTYDDSWKDIAGYATLIVNELNGEIK